MNLACLFRKYDSVEGFTLVELIASLVLLGLLAAIFGMGIVAAVRSNEFSRVNVQLAQKGQLAMARLSRELMELTRIEGYAADAQNTYVTYQRPHPYFNQAAVRMGIHYNSADGTVRLYTNLPVGTGPALDSATLGLGDILVDGVSAFSLSYFAGSAAWAGGNIRLLSTIEIDLRLRRRDNASVSQDFQTVVHLRNNGNYGGVAVNTTPASQGDYSCFITTVAAGRFNTAQIQAPDEKHIWTLQYLIGKSTWLHGK